MEHGTVRYISDRRPPKDFPDQVSLIRPIGFREYDF